MATEWNFNFKAEPQPITLKAGRYKLECWGACGGKKGVTAGNGGLGGYAKGELTLKKETILNVYVGEQGRDGSNAWTIFNGGGFGGVSTGGGATDIRLIAGDWGSQIGLLSRIIVAGGGGGHDSNTPTGNYSSAGGGTKGNNGVSTLSYHAPGATQYDGGRGADIHCDGSFCLGGGTIAYLQYCKCGGGGGWFGGAGSKVSSSAGGGSGYVLTKDSYKPAGYTATSEYYMINPSLATGNNTAKGHGYAKITLLQALPFLNISSYNSTQATFKADHTDPTLLTKIECFIDDVLKETITTDLTTEKTINYTLEDNALHTLKIVVTDSANATVEKVLSISKNIMPLPEENINLNDISTKLVEVNSCFKTGKTSIINTLALKNIEASLNNTLVELSEKIKTSFDSSDASVQELQNRITELTNELSRRKRFAKGTASLTISYVDNTVHQQIETNLSFRPSIILIKTNLFFTNSGFESHNCNLYSANNLTETYAVNANKNTGPGRASVYAQVVTISEKSFVLHFTTSLYFNVSQSSAITWYAFE
ncbi:glycine rich domain-containing protein [Clostridioides difficile]|uniref:glycine rich domain-containing protein n=1 Tax=Clostridioides difficile TaxID=1496 RepID=UPI000C9BBBBE|nr:glycine rich domain-containing protein [Clostridioides difficile]HBG7286502.1 hypothetical protein [Clostridioides difficile]